MSQFPSLFSASSGDPNQGLYPHVEKILSLFDGVKHWHTLSSSPEYSQFNLRMQAPKVVNVSRGDYRDLELAVFRDGERCLEIDGPTGCGKSTWAVWSTLQAFDGATLLVCPTDANVANILQEFNETIPRVKWTMGYGLDSLVPCSFVSLDTGISFPDRLVVTSAEKLASWMAHSRRWPPFLRVVIDEYHLRIDSVAFIRSMFMTYDFPGCAMFVSATPDGRSPPPPSMDGKIIVPRHLPDPLSQEGIRLSSPSSYENMGSGNVCTIVSSCLIAHKLHAALRKSCDAHLICIHSSVAASREAFRYGRKRAYVITPHVEAGITLNMSVFVDYRDVEQLVFQDGMLFSSVTKLSKPQFIQRLGRAGRVELTHVLADESRSSTNSTDYTVLYANTVIRVASFGAPVSDVVIPHTPSLSQFSRLPLLSNGALKICSQSPTPLSTMYTINNHGVKYTEFGGTAPNYATDNLVDMRLFTWRTGYVFAPYIDLVNDVDLSPLTIDSVAKPMLASYATVKGISPPPPKDAADIVKKRPLMFAQKFYNAIEKVLSGVSNWNGGVQKYDDQTSADNAVYSGSLDHIDYLFGEYAHVFRSLRAADLDLEYVKVATIAPGGTTRKLKPYTPDPNKFSVVFVRQIRFRTQRFTVFTGNVVTNGSVDRSLIDPEIKAALSPLLTSAMISADPHLSISLSDKKGLIMESNNTWAKSLTL